MSMGRNRRPCCHCLDRLLFILFATNAQLQHIVIWLASFRVTKCFTSCLLRAMAAVEVKSCVIIKTHFLEQVRH